MNFEEVLWYKSFKEWNFFYELIENNKFSINSYNELIENLKKYRDITKKDVNINKDIIQQLYIFMRLYIWTIRDYEEWKYIIYWVKNAEELFDYYEELDTEVISLLKFSDD